MRRCVRGESSDLFPFYLLIEMGDNTFVSRLQNLSLDIIEHLYRANDLFMQKFVLCTNEK